MSCLIRGFACVTILAAVLLAAPGCTSKKEDPAAPDHPHEGPHGGPLADWGDEKYHAEFIVDHDTKKATVYILDGTAKKAAPIAAESITLSVTNLQPPIQITLKADPETSDPSGSSSRFVGIHDKLATVMEFKGEISGKVGDTPYSGKFEEKPHDDHKHEKKK